MASCSKNCEKNHEFYGAWHSAPFNVIYDTTYSFKMRVEQAIVYKDSVDHDEE